MKSYRRTAWFHTLSFLSVLIAAGIAISVIYTLRNNHQRKQSRSDCALKGNQDMYGLGIRVGVYMQILTTALIDSFGTPEHSASLSAGNLWFLTALFAALSTILWSSDYYSVEGYIIISLGNGLTLIMLGGTLRLDPGDLKEGGLASFARFILWGIWKMYSAVFWWSSLDRATIRPCEITAVGWFFGSVSLIGWFQTFHKFLNVIEWSIWLFMGIFPYPFGAALLAYFLYKLDTSRWHPDPDKSASRTRIFIDYMFVPIGELHDIVFGKALSGDINEMRPSSVNMKEDKETVKRRLAAHMELRYRLGTSTDLDHRLPSADNTSASLYDHLTFTKVFWFRSFLSRLLVDLGITDWPYLVIWDMFVLAFTVLTIELTILTNEVTEVNYLGSAGQLIAFVVGMGGSLTAICQFYVEKRQQVLADRKLGARVLSS